MTLPKWSIEYKRNVGGIKEIGIVDGPNYRRFGILKKLEHTIHEKEVEKKREELSAFWGDYEGKLPLGRILLTEPFIDLDGTQEEDYVNVTAVTVLTDPILVQLLEQTLGLRYPESIHINCDGRTARPLDNEESKDLKPLELYRLYEKLKETGKPYTPLPY